MQEATPLFTPACLPPLRHLKAMSAFDAVSFDLGLFFRKQTLRNRYHILSPNGVQTLVVPTVHTGGKSVPMGEVRISYADNWPLKHWRSLEAAYRRSPFFEFYEDDLRPIYEQRPERLCDFNLMLMKWLWEAFQLQIRMEYIDTTPGPQQLHDFDYRVWSDTGDPVADADASPYLQVFSGKSTFVPGLSAIDYLFNCGGHW